MIASQSKTIMVLCVCVCVYDVPVCIIYQGDVRHKLAQVVQNGYVCDKETKGTDSKKYGIG